MDIDRFNREQAEADKQAIASPKYDLQPGEFICPRCKEYIIDEDRRYHPCSREGVTVPAVYIPNRAKMTKSDSKEYRKHAGSRPAMKRMVARLKGRGLLKNWNAMFADIPFVQTNESLQQRLRRMKPLPETNWKPTA